MNTNIRQDSLLLLTYLVLFATMSNPPDAQNTLKRSFVESDGHWKILGQISLTELNAEMELSQKYLEIVQNYCIVTIAAISIHPTGCRKLPELFQRIIDIEEKANEFLELPPAVEYMNKLQAAEEDDLLIDVGTAFLTFLQNSREVYAKSIEHIKNIHSDGIVQIMKSNNALSSIEAHKMINNAEYRAKIVKQLHELLNTDSFFLQEIVNRFEVLQNNLLKVCQTGSLTFGNQFLSQETLMILLNEIERHLKDDANYCIQKKKLILPFSVNHTDYRAILDTLSIKCFIYGPRLSYEIQIPLVAKEKYSLYHTNL